MATGPGRAVRVDWMKVFTNVATTKTYSTPHAALMTGNPNDDGQGNSPAGTLEPTSSNGYARQAITWNTISTPSNDAAAQATNNGAITFGPSSGGGFSTGATALTYLAVYNTATLATVTEAAFLGRALIAGGGFAVNAAGVSITFATNTGIVFGSISA
jgi:hypothetical protein